MTRDERIMEQPGRAETTTAPQHGLMSPPHGSRMSRRSAGPPSLTTSFDSGSTSFGSDYHVAVTGKYPAMPVNAVL